MLKKAVGKSPYLISQMSLETAAGQPRPPVQWGTLHGYIDFLGWASVVRAYNVTDLILT